MRWNRFFVECNNVHVSAPTTGATNKSSLNKRARMKKTGEDLTSKKLIKLSTTKHDPYFSEQHMPYHALVEMFTHKCSIIYRIIILLFNCLLDDLLISSMKKCSRLNTLLISLPADVNKTFNDFLVVLFFLKQLWRSRGLCVLLTLRRLQSS